MKTHFALRPHIQVRLCILMAFVAFAQALPAWNYLTVYRNDGEEPLMLFSDDVDSLVYSKIGIDGILYNDWQVQEIWAPDTTYRIPLACIDSIKMKAVDSEAVIKDVVKTSMQVSSFFVESESIKELASHLEEIRQIETVEKAWVNGVSLFVKVKDWGNISFSYPQNYEPLEEDTEQANERRNVSKANEYNYFGLSDVHIPIYDNPSDYQICIVNQAHNDLAREYERRLTSQMEKNFNSCGFKNVKYVYGDEFGTTFFNEKFYNYDIILMCTHGEYDGQQHWIYTGKEYFVTDQFVEIDKWTDKLDDWVYLEQQLLNEKLQGQNSPNSVSCGFIREARKFNNENKIVLVCYAKLSETAFAKNKKHFRGEGTSILFNMACQSLQDNSSLADILVKKGLGYYLGYTHSNTIGLAACYEFTNSLLNGYEVDGAMQTISKKCLSQVIDEMDLDGNVYYANSVLHKIANPSSRNAHTCITKPQTLDTANTFDNILHGEIRQLNPSNAGFTYGFCISKDKDMKSSIILKEIPFRQCKFDSSNKTVSFDLKLENPVKLNSGADYKLESGTYYYCSYIFDGKYYCLGDVKKFEYEQNSACPDDNHPHMIDLGLPSGTKWACCNVGANTPEGYGGYYAWGEVEEKGYYSWDTYQYWTDSDGDGYRDSSEITNLGSDIAGTGYDVAHVQWGGSWVMPSFDQIKELLNNCSTQWTTKNGVNGRIFTGPSGGTIFLPAAGNRLYDYLGSAGSIGDYWSSTQSPSGSYDAYSLYFNSGVAILDEYYDRFHGLTVRPVAK